jgi:hypothetical protein
MVRIATSHAVLAVYLAPWRSRKAGLPRRGISYRPAKIATLAGDSQASWIVFR